MLFEFTEQGDVDDPGHVANIVAEYRRLGFMTAVDDFGAGHAGLAMLAQYQPDLLKIDMELVRDIDKSRARQVIVAGIVAMAQHLGINLLAEGIESEDEIAVLQAAGIDLMQGYYFAHPGFQSLPDVDFAAGAKKLRASA